MKDDAAPDQAPTVPAIPLRARQRHRARSKKGASSRWLARREEPGSGREEVPLESATFETVSVTPPPVGIEDDFFAAGDSVAPVVQEASSEEAPAGVPAPRRGLAAIVVGAVALAGVLCVAAVTRPSATVAPVAASAPVTAMTTEAPLDIPPPPDPVAEPVVTPVPAKELRETARTELTKRRLPEAIAAALDATKVEPGDAEGWLLLGAAQLEAGRATEAKEAFLTCTHVAKTGPIGECRSFAR